MRPSALGLLLAAGLLSACATTHDVSPGFQQAEGGTILIVSGRSLEDVWPAALRGATVASQAGHQTLTTQNEPRVIQIEGKDVVGWLVSYWVAIRLDQRDEDVRIYVSKWYRHPSALIKDGPSEGDYLRAIQRELAPR
jgi:hypothetical protein